MPVPLYQQRRRDEMMERITAQLTPEELDEAFARGRAHDLDRAIEIALDG
jgi:hypothetical protein